MNLQRSRLRPHADCQFHVSFENMKSHTLKVITRYTLFPNREDKAEAMRQTNDLRVLWKKAREINEYPRLVRLINIKLFTLHYVFKSQFILTPIYEI